MGLFSKKPTIVVHDGRFHADDIFACATLTILLGKIKIVRSRDQAVIEAADYVMDVGGIYDPSLKRFDHHQPGGAGVRENGIPYAAFGLVWKEYGQKICGDKEVADRVEKMLVLAIDAGDNAVTTFTAVEGKPLPFLIQSSFSVFMPTWKEGDITYDQFVYLVGVAEQILRREIIQSRDFLEGEREIARIYAAAPDKRVIVLEKMYPWEEGLIKYPEPLLVVATRSTRNTWKVEATLVAQGSFERRMYMPKEWAGLRDEELAKVTGVPDAVFCHNGRFIAVAKSKEGALALAKLALSSNTN